jgi:hypothetical protein
MNINKAKLRSTLSAIIAALVMFGPDILDALSVTDASPKWVKLVAKGLGALVFLATNGKAVAILNKLLPDDKQTVTVAQQPDTTEAKGSQP